MGEGGDGVGGVDRMHEVAKLPSTSMKLVTRGAERIACTTGAETTPGREGPVRTSPEQSPVRGSCIVEGTSPHALLLNKAETDYMCHEHTTSEGGHTGRVDLDWGDNKE